MGNKEYLQHLFYLSLKQEGGTEELGTREILTKLQSASARLSSSMDHERIPNSICQEFSQLFSAQASFLHVLEMGRNQTTLLAKSVPKNGFPDDCSALELGDFPFKTSVLTAGEIRHYPVNDLNGTEKKYKVLIENGVRSILVVPLIRHERTVGWIEVYDDRDRVYGESDLAAARILAAHSTTALGKLDLIQRLERSIIEQEALHDASLAISSSLDINGILSKIAEEVCALVEATSVYISTLDPDSKISKGIVAYYGQNANDKERLSDLGKPYDHSLDFQEVLSMFKTGKPKVYTVDSPNVDEAVRQHIESYGGKSVMEIPLQVSGEFLGIIEIWDSQKIRNFSKEEIYLCETIAQQAAIALGNAKLYEKAQEEIRVRKELEARLRYDAFHDVLTKLPNRLLFYDRLEQAILRRKRSKESNFAVLYVDLDRFKSVNDSYGHMTGDIVLVQAAKAIRECVRVGDTVSRFGGDEFLILLNGDINSGRIKKITDRIQTNLRALRIDPSHKLFLSASIGLVISSSEIDSADAYLKSADVAMYAAKMKGGARVESFSFTQELKTRTKANIQSEIIEASENHEFRIHFQPIMDFYSFNVVGLEALLRWRRKSGELIPPSEFISQLEDLGLISQVGNWVISEAINHFLRWQTKNSKFSNLSLSVNVSINQLVHPRFIAEIKQILGRTRFDPTRLVIEVTESILMSDLALVTDTLSDLRELGINVHLDDFGTGFSSLSYLSDLPVNGIKIDRRFIEKLGPLMDQPGLLVNILVIANDLGLNVIAEGIETELQLITLMGLNCQYGQGFLFSPGLEPDEVEYFIERDGNALFDYKYC